MNTTSTTRSMITTNADQSYILGATHRPLFLVRRVTTRDAAPLVDLLTKLSARTRQMRYMVPLPMSPETARLEAMRIVQGQTNHHLALIAWTNEAGGSKALAVAELIRDDRSPMSAEIAVVVRDDYQGQGIGRDLVERLIQHARSSGINSVRADVLAENRPMLRLLRGLGLPQNITTQRGETQVIVRIQPSSSGYSHGIHQT